ncbi:hypothetical protein PR048_013792 [Dryococelus australis]|uniref:Serine carboxypeptidase n=1 Tax=Dryococelus australis TaxID=614101 RepID=A0ABQ9HTZ8_9NEOP|nr:hypothetical protein PR048_013792 [Dryococelus australis]
MASVSVYNVLQSSSTIDSDYARFLQKESVRLAIHVGSEQYSTQSDTVYSYLLKDIMKSVRPWVEELLDSGYRVVFFNGQLDVICGYALTVKMVEALQFNSAEEYKAASRRIWNVNGEVAGYTKTAGNMTEVLVRKAGHMVPSDQPVAAFDLIYRITRNHL